MALAPRPPLIASLHCLADNGEIPRKLQAVTPPKCAGCIFGAMTKVPWQTRATPSKHVFIASAPGKCMSVDQLQSTQVGFIAQLKGKLTKQRFTAATIFVDHFSRVRYIYLMCNLSSNETIQAKQAFEQFALHHSVAIRHYHCDNGCFADKAFAYHCEDKHQSVTYCGVNAHFQNGIAKKAFCNLQESARKQLLHAMARWPKAVHVALWPYALRFAAHLPNTVPTLEDSTLQLEKISSPSVGSNMRNFYTFACPVFVLHSNLAAGRRISKWSQRARLGLNLGPSPYHAFNVNLVLNLSTGLVSPPFHQ